MLIKLLKHDLAKIFKFISVFYIITFSVSILTRIFIKYDSPFILFLTGRILSGGLISMFANILINLLMGLWIRSFRRGIYGDESYLTHTLPVTPAQIYISKLLSAIIVSAASFAVIAASAFIGYYTEERWLFLKNTLLAGTSGGMIILLLVLLFLEIINLIQCGFTGTVLGHRLNGTKAVMSVIFSCLTFTVTQLIVLIAIAIIAVFNNDFKAIFTHNAAVTQPILRQILYTAVIIYAALCFCIALFNIKLLSRGVNVE